MTRIQRWLVDSLSATLRPDEREAALGDLAERGEGGGRALRELLGLVLRRQADAWMRRQAWLVLVGVVFPVGILLSDYSRSTADGSAITLWLYFNNWDWAFLASPAFQHDFPRFLAVVLGDYAWLFFLSWAGGLILGALSRGTVALPTTLFCIALMLGSQWSFLHRARDYGPNAAVFAVGFYRSALPALVQIVLILLPALWGMSWGRYYERRIASK